MCRFDVKRGNILIGVLWVIVIMTILVLALSVEARSDINRTMLHRDRARAYWLARAAVERVKYDYAANRANAAQEGGENRTRYSFEFEDGYAECLLLSNSSLMSINSNNRDMWRQLLSLYDLDDGVKDEIVDAIIDWQDPDDLVSLNGAEEEYYETLNPPYMPRNGAFFSLDELLLVRGITETMFYGGNFGGEPKPGLADILTVSSQKIARFDINSCPKGILMAFLEVTGEEADEIIRIRDEQSFQNVSEAAQHLPIGGTEKLNQYFMTYRGGQFTIRATGYVRDSRARYTVEDEVRYTGGARLFSHLSHKDFSLDHVDGSSLDEENNDR